MLILIKIKLHHSQISMQCTSINILHAKITFLKATCGAIKQKHESEVGQIPFRFIFLVDVYTSFAKLPFTTNPIKIAKFCSKRYSQLTCCKTIWNNKQNHSLLLGYILKSIFASSDSFSLITAHIVTHSTGF